MNPANQLKYQVEIAAFDPCPRKTRRVDGELVGYRFSHNPINDPANFTPIAGKDLSRLTGREHNFCCSAYGLSMFESVEQLHKKIKALEKFNPFVRQSLGQLWVGVTLNAESGEVTVPDKSGHFNLHESHTFKGEDLIVSSGNIE